MAETAAPTSVAEAQLQAFTEHAEEEAAKTAALAAEQQADLAKRAEALAAVPAPPPAGEPGPVERERLAVQASYGPRNVNMVTTEEERLSGIKAAIKDHLKSVELDMTGGVGKPEPTAAAASTADPATADPAPSDPPVTTP